MLGLLGDRLSGAGMTAVSLGVLAVIAVTVSPPVDSSGGGNAVGYEEPIIPITQTQPSRTASSNPAMATRAKVPGESKQSVADPASSLVDDVINPNQNATPETTTLHSLAPSPNYESDHTVLAAGLAGESSSPRSWVLFISPDGGGTWEPRPSRFLGGSTIVLPPKFPQDERIFTSGGLLGLQQSDDGGASFRTVSPSLGSGLAISPSFGRGDPIVGGDSRILIGGYSVLEYDAGTGVTQPALLTVPPTQRGRYSSIAFSPSYQSDLTVFASDQWGASYRCKGSVCDVMQLPQPGGQLILRFPSPGFDQDGLAYAFTPYKLLVSQDGAQTFGEVQFPLEVQLPLMGEGYIRDVAIAWNVSSNPAIFAAVFESSTLSRYPPGIYRSLDAGRSWSRTSIDLLGFGGGYAKKLIVTPTGRVLATGVYNGIACSVDGGQTWAPRCPPEP